MSWKHSLAGALFAATVLAAQSASATVIKGYTDLYATWMRAGFEQYGDDTQHNLFEPCDPSRAGPCAKTRLSFTHDTTKPPHAMRISLELVKAYYSYDPERPNDGYFPSVAIEGREYLPLPFYSQGDPQASYQPLGPRFSAADPNAPDESWVPADRVVFSYDLTRFAVGQPGAAFWLDFAAKRVATWGEGEPCALDDEYYEYCRNDRGQRPGEGSEGPFYPTGHVVTTDETFTFSNLGHGAFGSLNDNVHWWARFPFLGTSNFVRYAFDNDPANWLDGAPRSRIWIVAAPEPASLSLLAVGLLALLGVRTKHR